MIPRSFGSCFLRRTPKAMFTYFADDLRADFRQATSKHPSSAERVLVVPYVLHLKMIPAHPASFPLLPNTLSPGHVQALRPKYQITNGSDYLSYKL